MTAHSLTVERDIDRWVARCSCGTWKTEVINFGSAEDWPSDQTLVDFRTWHGRHLKHLSAAPPSSTPATPPPWINVDERYPAVGQHVVYFFDVCGTYVGTYGGEHCFVGEAGFLTDDVTHWMPYYKPKRRRSVEHGDAPQASAAPQASKQQCEHWLYTETDKAEMGCPYCELAGWNRMFDAWVKHQAGLPSAVPLWPNPDWPQDVAMVAHALAGSRVETSPEPVAWRKLINSPYERHPRYGYSEEEIKGGEPLYHLHNRPDVMNPPQSAAEGCEARNVNTANVMGLGQVHRATEARPAEVAPLPETACSDGYKDAFYQIAELLGLTAMPISPKAAFETVMLPRLRELVTVKAEAEHVPVSDEEAAQIDEAVRAGRITFAPGWNDDPECTHCARLRSEHIGEKLICPDAAIPDVYRFTPAEPSGEAT